MVGRDRGLICTFAGTLQGLFGALGHRNVLRPRQRDVSSSAHSGTMVDTGQMLVAVRKQGAQPHPAGSRSKTRLIRSRREFCLFVKREVFGPVWLVVTMVRPRSRSSGLPRG